MSSRASSAHDTCGSGHPSSAHAHGPSSAQPASSSAPGRPHSRNGGTCRSAAIGCGTFEIAYTSSPASARRRSSESAIPPFCEPARRSSFARSVRTVRLPNASTRCSVVHAPNAPIDAAAPRTSSGSHRCTAVFQNSAAVGACASSRIAPSTPQLPSSTVDVGAVISRIAQSRAGVGDGGRRADGDNEGEVRHEIASRAI